MTEPPSGWNPPDAPAEGYGTPPQAPVYAPQQAWYGAPPQPGIVPLRPLGLGELIDGAIKILRRYPRPTLGLSAAIAAVVTVLNVVIVLLVDTRDTFGTVDDDGNTDFSFSYGNAATTPGEILRALAGLVLVGAIVAVVGKAVLGHQVSTSEVWATVKPRLWALVGLSLLTGLIVFAPIAVGLLLVIIAAATGGGAAVALAVIVALGGAGVGAYFYTRFSLAPAALVLEKASITTSLRRSTVLVRGSWWRIFWILVLTGIIGGVLGAILGIPLGIAAVVAGSEGSTGFQVAEQVATGLAAVIVAPFTSGVRALLYVDRRMRAEGLDVALAAAAAGAGAPPA